MKKHLAIACLYTVVTAVCLGLIYPLVITGVAHLLFRDKADGQLLSENGVLVGSHLLGQPFTGAGFFHSRPSAAGTGYDAAASSGSNLAASSRALVSRVDGSVAAERGDHAGAAVPIDLVTASGSGLDPDISPAAALYQVGRVARERHLGEASVRALVLSHIRQRQFGLLGEPRVNVVDLNLALESLR